MKIIVLLAGMTRGGIDLFQSLLDNHPQISQLPGKFYVDDFLKWLQYILIVLEARLVMQLNIFFSHSTL